MTDWPGREATEALRALGRGFTADDVRELAGQPDDTYTANAANNAIGSWFSRNSKAGLIRPTGRTAKSRTPTRKGGLIQEWEFVPPEPGLFG